MFSGAVGLWNWSLELNGLWNWSRELVSGTGLMSSRVSGAPLSAVFSKAVGLWS